MKAYGAEFLGTFWLMLGGCGCAVLAACWRSRCSSEMPSSMVIVMVFFAGASSVRRLSNGYYEAQYQTPQGSSTRLRVSVTTTSFSISQA